ncbi:ABC transporter ATP-binding protein [Longibacter salinarum]|uniref:ABC transporter ATP-binding protein n=1 Tax=Longibacter salinarum TaxID=1850348 RepID=A0A2A8CXP2_9BACT|nr:ABC transporter ATP-binding protein [Longibacter salinarum]PEN13393.1 ABC transporter ATP-binding protein [Longibacter salinarum]
MSSSPAPSAASSDAVSSNSAPSLVTFDDVAKTYEMGSETVTALTDISITIPQGQFVAVVGPSGSGKSTFLHLLSAMDRPSRGRITVGDWDLGSLDRQQQARFRRSMIGIIFQQFHLVPTMTARENVALPLILAGVAPSDRQGRAANALDIVGLGDRMDHRPAELSGGEQQRVAVARALVTDPPLLLADEPTGNLDSETGEQIIDLLEHVHHEQGRTVVVVTHHFDEVQHVTERVLKLRDGRILADEDC